MCLPTMRITMSVALPGPNGTTTLTGLLGNLSWACAPNAVTARQSTRTDPNRRMGMAFLFLGGVRPRHRPACDADVTVRMPDLCAPSIVQGPHERPRRGYSAASTFTCEVMSFQVLISSASQALASSSDLFGTILKFCFLKASTTGGASSAWTEALKIVSRTSFGVPAGANSPCHAIVPTPG